MASDRVRICKRGLEWQVRHGDKVVYACGSHQGAMEYVAAQLKIRDALVSLGSKLAEAWRKK